VVGSRAYQRRRAARPPPPSLQLPLVSRRFTLYRRRSNQLHQICARDAQLLSGACSRTRLPCGDSTLSVASRRPGCSGQLCVDDRFDCDDPCSLSPRHRDAVSHRRDLRGVARCHRVRPHLLVGRWLARRCFHGHGHAIGVGRRSMPARSVDRERRAGWSDGGGGVPDANNRTNVRSASSRVADVRRRGVFPPTTDDRCCRCRAGVCAYRCAVSDQLRDRNRRSVLRHQLSHWLLPLRRRNTL
jgi:hypothetical protein